MDETKCLVCGKDKDGSRCSVSILFNRYSHDLHIEGTCKTFKADSPDAAKALLEVHLNRVPDALPYLVVALLPVLPFAVGSIFGGIFGGILSSLIYVALYFGALGLTGYFSPMNKAKRKLRAAYTEAQTLTILNQIEVIKNETALREEEELKKLLS